MATASELLIELGVNVGSKGGRQLTRCVELAADDPTLTDSIVKVLYPMVADASGTSAKATERIIIRELRLVTGYPNWGDRLASFESRHGCKGLLSGCEHQTLKPFIQKVAYILNKERPR